jgi:hypothetical protein
LLVGRARPPKRCPGFAPGGMMIELFLNYRGNGALPKIVGDVAHLSSCFGGAGLAVARLICATSHRSVR